MRAAVIKEHRGLDGDFKLHVLDARACSSTGSRRPSERLVDSLSKASADLLRLTHLPSPTGTVERLLQMRTASNRAPRVILRSTSDRRT
jgi:hypothetical protein